jgi:hypothetical protein
LITNAKPSDRMLTGNRGAVPSGSIKQPANVESQAARLAEIERKYTLQVIVTDQVGREVLNLTKVCLERDLPGKVATTPEIHEVLELLVEAAGEWRA